MDFFVDFCGFLCRFFVDLFVDFRGCFVEKTSKTSVTQGRCCCTLAIEKYQTYKLISLVGLIFCLSVCLTITTFNNTTTVRAKETLFNSATQ